MSRPTLTPFSTATAMLAALRQRQISAVELLELQLRQIERHNPTINVIVVADFDRARQAAVAADAARARGDDRPLLGLPVTIKESFNVAGLPTSVGLKQWANAIATDDAIAVRRLKTAGAVIMGKTNVSPMLVDWQADNEVYGRTNNPWDLTRSPGGSTGGGAAVAAGLSPLELGSDIGGSIRVPASFGGVFGHKPSESALPRSGQFPGFTLPNPAIVLAVQGPLARDAADLELAFDVLAGADVGEDAAWRLDLPAARHTNLRDFRVVIAPPIDWLPVDASIADALARLGATLREAGCQVSEMMPAWFADTREFYEQYLSLLGAMIAPPDAEARAGLAAAWRATGDRFSIALANGATASALDLIGWHGLRERRRDAARAFFRDWDIVITPVTPTPAFPHQSGPIGERWLTVNGAPVRYSWQNFFPGLATLIGLPATALPVGLSPTGLPIGLQAIGPYLEDRTSIRLAQRVTELVGGYQVPPMCAPD